MTDTKNTNKLSCEVIQDLMPSYVDGIASEETAKIIEEHLRGCAECRAMFENMKADGQADMMPDDKDRKEIDFLKKSRKRGRRSVLLGILLTALVAAAAVGARFYLIGSEYHGDMAMDIKAEGNAMTVGATAADSIHIIKKIDFTMNDGVARGTVKAVLPGILHSSGTFTTVPADDEAADPVMTTCDWSGYFAFDEDIREVWIGDRLWWADGNPVSVKVSNVLRAAHDYVGDSPANGASIQALEITDDLGSLYTELQTDKEPYGMTIILDEDQTKYRPDYLDKRLEGYAYALLGTVGNLGEVDFRYTAGGRTVTKKVTEEDASDFLGKDIKTCRADAGALSELLEKCDLD